MKNIKQALKNKRLYFDGGFGSLAIEMGLPLGVAPENWNLTAPENVIKIHREYVDAGANIITTNTFGVNAEKYENYQELIINAVDCVKTATQNSDVFIAFDIGPLGKMLKPYGDLSFDQAVELFAKNVRIADKLGVDLFIVETMGDLSEVKAAVVAIKENSTKPIFVTAVFDKSGKMMTGGNPLAFITLVEGLGVDALGMNCSFGPDSMLDLIDEFVENSSTPIITNPNAGLPMIVDGKTVYATQENEFSAYMVALANRGVNILGGCCGTTPKHIKTTIEKTKDIPFVPIQPKNKTVVSSFTHAITFDKPILIGERINPTGKSKLKDALKNRDYSYILSEAIRQSDKGAQVLDVNVGLAGIDEIELLKEVVSQIQAVIDTPLQIDTANTKALEQALRVYNGKALVNSVNGKKQVMDEVFPIVKKYGGCVIALTLNENGIPSTPQERLNIAIKICDYAKTFGLEKKDIIVDALCMAVSADQTSAKVTLDTVKLLKQNGFKTVLGISNVSFGLPEREKINSTFLTMALENGLDSFIANPYSNGILDSYFSYNVLTGKDNQCCDYIQYTTTPKIEVNQDVTLKSAIIGGLKEIAIKLTRELLKTTSPLTIINNHIIPALNEVGDQFKNNKIYLPNLLVSAETASAVFEIIKDTLPKNSENKGSLILATVKGDVHDIGKNIVKVLVESYGYKVIDLGKDVDSQTICNSVKTSNCHLVGLSALMTTTLPNMQESIRELHQLGNVTVIVGGAVLNQEFADQICADFYAKDALDTVKFVEKYYQNAT